MKNIGLLVRAVAVLAGRNIPVRLKLTGDPEAGLNKLAAVKHADLPHWTGWLGPGRLLISTVRWMFSCLRRKG